MSSGARPARCFERATLSGKAEQPETTRRLSVVVGLKREIHLARRRLAQVLDAALAVERERARPRQSRAARHRACRRKREFRVELAGGNIGQHQLADAQRHMHVVVAERAERVGLGVGGRAVLAPRRRAARPARSAPRRSARADRGGRCRASGRSGASRRRGSAARRGIWCRSARPARRPAELAVADGGIAPKREIAHRRLSPTSRDRPTAQRVSVRSLEPSSLIGPAKTGPTSPCARSPESLDAVSPGSSALRRSILTLPSAAASARPRSPTRSPPSLACSMATASVPSPNWPASVSTSSASM